MVAAFLHKHGWARVLNNQAGQRMATGRAYVQSYGPEPVARWLAVYAVRQSPLCPADWLTIHLDHPQRCSRWEWRWQVTYKRCA